MTTPQKENIMLEKLRSILAKFADSFAEYCEMNDINDLHAPFTIDY